MKSLTGTATGQIASIMLMLVDRRCFGTRLPVGVESYKCKLVGAPRAI